MNCECDPSKQIRSGSAPITPARPQLVSQNIDIGWHRALAPQRAARDALKLARSRPPPKFQLVMVYTCNKGWEGDG